MLEMKYSKYTHKINGFILWQYLLHNRPLRYSFYEINLMYSPAISVYNYIKPVVYQRFSPANLLPQLITVE